MRKELNSRLCKVRAAMELINDPDRKVKLMLQGDGEYEYYVELKEKTYIKNMLWSELYAIEKEIKEMDDADGDNDSQNIDDIF